LGAVADPPSAGRGPARAPRDALVGRCGRGFGPAGVDDRAVRGRCRGGPGGSGPSAELRRGTRRGGSGGARGRVASHGRRRVEARSGGGASGDGADPRERPGAEAGPPLVARAPRGRRGAAGDSRRRPLDGCGPAAGTVRTRDDVAVPRRGGRGPMSASVPCPTAVRAASRLPTAVAVVGPTAAGKAEFGL